MKHHSRRYFAASIPMPENLRDIDSYVQSLRVSIATETAARCFAASNCSTREYWITAQEPDPTGVDPASQSAVERYLRGIVAPLRFATIGAMWEDISLLEFYDAAVDVVALHEIRPALAQAALRLDIAGLWRMAAPPDDRITELLDALVPQLLAIAVLGHVKHYAQALAVQLHRPTGLPALDRLDYDRSRQAPKHGTVCREFSHNLEVAQFLSEAYTPSTQLGGVDGYRDAPACDARTVRILSELGLFKRARAEMKGLAAVHGDDLEGHLDQIMADFSQLCGWMAPMIDGISSMYHYNTTIGNIGRTPATVLLYLVIEQAVTWLAAPHREDVDEPTKSKRKPPAEWPPDVVARISKRATRGSVVALPASQPRRIKTRAMVDNVHAAYRFAILGDNESVPAKFRSSAIGNPGAWQCHNNGQYRSQKEGSSKFNNILRKFRSNAGRGKVIDAQAQRDASEIRKREWGLQPDAQTAVRFMHKAFSLHL